MSDGNNRPFGAWTAQVRAVAVAHLFVAAANLYMAFKVKWFMDFAIGKAVEIAAPTLPEIPPSELRAELAASVAWAVPVIVAVIALFSILIALNGWFLWRGRNWARINAIVIGVLMLPGPALPFGIWFLYVCVARDVADTFRNKAAPVHK
ncbi:MAG: hypothetical protein HRF49_02400 [bacterium]